MIRPEDIRELLKKQPFQPFRMHMSNGQTFDVPHPELAMVTRSTIIVSRPVPGAQDSLGEGVQLVSVIHINHIEMLPVGAGSKTA